MKVDKNEQGYEHEFPIQGLSIVPADQEDIDLYDSINFPCHSVVYETNRVNFKKNDYVVLLSNCTGNPDDWLPGLPVNIVYQLSEDSNLYKFRVVKDLKGNKGGWSSTLPSTELSNLRLRAATEKEIALYKFYNKPYNKPYDILGDELVGMGVNYAPLDLNSPSSISLTIGSNIYVDGSNSTMYSLKSESTSDARTIQISSYVDRYLKMLVENANSSNFKKGSYQKITEDYGIGNVSAGRFGFGRDSYNWEASGVQLMPYDFFLPGTIVKADICTSYSRPHVQGFKSKKNELTLLPYKKVKISKYNK